MHPHVSMRSWECCCVRGRSVVGDAMTHYRSRREHKQRALAHKTFYHREPWVKNKRGDDGDGTRYIYILTVKPSQTHHGHKQTKFLNKWKPELQVWRLMWIFALLKSFKRVKHSEEPTCFDVLGLRQGLKPEATPCGPAYTVATANRNR